ncbi:hypothetical protein [Bradyrhizobium sp.]|jgi:hypothetical protein|uniref:hypothetical protein n=1 Tax=Bradyrhizobium sp. TaxID=376 RepID=UPI003BB03A1F
MRSAGGTNFGFAGVVVSRTKSRIACFAVPSFHDGSAPLDVVVYAEAEMDKKGADNVGRNAKVEMRARRSMLADGSIGFIFGFSLG